MTEPLPPIAQDPSVTRGRAVRQAFTLDAAAIRGDVRLAEVVQAEQIVALWEATNGELIRLWRDLQARWAARVAVLDANIPSGPGVPGNASAADTALLFQAFRGALSQARDTDAAGRKSMLADAQSFGDDVLLRGVITAAIELGESQLVRSYAAMNGSLPELEELTELHAEQAGNTVGGLIVRQALMPIKAPPELAALPTLQAASDQAAALAAHGLTLRR